MSTLKDALARLDVGLCWEWTGPVDRRGYGKLSGRMAHRVIWELLVGPLPRSEQLDHLCRNHPCCNPDHLGPVTPAENARRGQRAKATHCANNHEFTPENTYLRQRGDRPAASRTCRACNSAAVARYKERNWS